LPYDECIKKAKKKSIPKSYVTLTFVYHLLSGKATDSFYELSYGVKARNGRVDEGVQPV
jgi:hypothetical protein